jgi:hypothetical protein
VTSQDLYAGAAEIIAVWDDMTDLERDRMPDDVWGAIIELRRILDALEVGT